MKTRTSFVALLALLVCMALNVQGAQLTFQVDMSAQTALGKFNPASDEVVVAGNPLNNWSTTESPLTPSTANANVWVGTFDVTASTGSAVQYKFVMRTTKGVVWEGNVGPNGAQNRSVLLTNAIQVLPVVFFNNVTGATSVSPKITFQVDLSVQGSLGNFDASTDSVSVAGDFNSWNSAALELTNSSANPNLFTGTTTLTGAPNSTALYKFVIRGATWEGNVGPNGSQNRSLTLTSTNQVLPVVYFNNIGVQLSVFPLTFKVNMGVQIAQGKFSPDADSVSVAGDPLNAWSGSASPLERSVTDSNTWVGTYDVTNSVGNTVLYKFVVNGGTWEAGDNHAYTIASTNAQTLPAAYFDGIDNLGAVTTGPISGGKLALSWTAGPLIRLQNSANASQGPWQTVPNTEGQSSVTVDVSLGNSFFRLVGP